MNQVVVNDDATPEAAGGKANLDSVLEDSLSRLRQMIIEFRECGLFEECYFLAMAHMAIRERLLMYRYEN